MLASSATSTWDMDARSPSISKQGGGDPSLDFVRWALPVPQADAAGLHDTGSFLSGNDPLFADRLVLLKSYSCNTQMGITAV